MQLNFPSVSLAEFAANPGLVAAALGDWLKEKRWFMDKDTAIQSLAIEDSFRLVVDEQSFVSAWILQFRLRKPAGLEFTKHYFVPTLISSEPITGIADSDRLTVCLSDGIRHISLAEHSSLFQQALIRALQTAQPVTTQNANTVNFTPQGQQLTAVDLSTLTARSLNVSTSNVLTAVTTNRGTLISKTYKDMRGASGIDYRQWPPNMEMPRYEALAAAGYANMPALHGMAYYLLTGSNSRVPLLLIMDAIDNVGDVGGIFWTDLSWLLDHADVAASSNSLNRRVIRQVSQQLAATVAEFHHAFLQSGKTGFDAVPATLADLTDWGNTTVHRYEQARLALQDKADQHPDDAVLRDLVNRLQALAPYFGQTTTLEATANQSPVPLPQRLQRLHGTMLKAQVHGDLSSAQGLIASLASSNPITPLFAAITQGNESAAFQAADALIKQVRWVDFEGEPAKDPVASDFDPRQNLLVDVASIIQGFWYIANIKLYEYLQLQPQENAQHKEPARRASLVLAGQLSPVAAQIANLTAERVQTIHTWLADTSDSFIQGYLDTVEALRMENAILTEWHRPRARAIIYYWTVFRTLHELRYETYGRDFGWEGIPGGRILQLISQVEIS